MRTWRKYYCDMRAIFGLKGKNGQCRRCNISCYWFICDYYLRVIIIEELYLKCGFLDCMGKMQRIQLSGCFILFFNFIFCLNILFLLPIADFLYH